MKTIEANNLLDLADRIKELHWDLYKDGYVKPVLTIVNRDTAPVYTLIVTER